MGTRTATVTKNALQTVRRLLQRDNREAREPIITQRTCPTCNGIIYLDNAEWDEEEQKYYYRHRHNCK